MIHHCPRCELRFVSEAEVKEHLALDHAVSLEGLGRYGYPATGATTRDLYPEDTRAEDESVPQAAPRRYLVIANQTLAGEILLEEIRRRAAVGAASFHVLVPATRSVDYVEPARTFAGAGGATPPDEGPDDKGIGQASWRLRKALDMLQSAGIECSGEIGPPDPVAAVSDLLRRREHQFDEVLLSTLPPGLSRWLGADLPGQVRRMTRLPVSTIVSPG